MKKLIWCTFVLFFLVGCASNIQILQRESARNIGNNLKPTDIKISDVKRGALMLIGKQQHPMEARTNAVQMIWLGGSTVSNEILHTLQTNRYNRGIFFAMLKKCNNDRS